MIGRPDIVARVAEWQLAEEVIEKDYVLGWLLWGIGCDPDLGDQAGTEGWHVPEEVLQALRAVAKNA